MIRCEDRAPPQPRHLQEPRGAVLQAQGVNGPGGLRPAACFAAGMDHARSAPLSAKAQVEALFDSLALEYLRERDRQGSVVSPRGVVIDFLAEAKGRLPQGGC